MSARCNVDVLRELDYLVTLSLSNKSRSKTTFPKKFQATSNNFPKLLFLVYCRFPLTVINVHILFVGALDQGTDIELDLFSGRCTVAAQCF